MEKNIFEGLHLISDSEEGIEYMKSEVERVKKDFGEHPEWFNYGHITPVGEYTPIRYSTNRAIRRGVK